MSNAALRRALLVLLFIPGAIAQGEPLSRKVEVDFFRDAPSRGLKGMATRADGRLVLGPSLRELAGAAPADLLWCVEPTAEPSVFLVGGGPEGRIFQVNLDPAGGGYRSQELARVDDSHVFALRRLPDGTLLAGSSPKGSLSLIKDGKPLARAQLPVDSIFDIALLDAQTALVATGNPGRIYRVNLTAFARGGIVADKIADPKILGERGITLFGEIRDRNVRRVVTLPDGGVAAGSSPRGNVYRWPAAGGDAVLLHENRDAEVTDLLSEPNGDLFATIVYSAGSGESRITPPARSGGRDREREGDGPAAPDSPRFGGRSAVVWIPANGFPEVLLNRAGAALYRMARYDGLLLLAGGDSGELLGLDLAARLALSFSGSVSAQLNGLVPLASSPGKFLVLRNNAPGFSVLEFNGPSARQAETRRLDLGAPAQLGAIRFGRLRNVDPASLTVEARVNLGSDEIEGWGPWTRLAHQADGSWRGEGLRGRSAKLRISVAKPEALPAGAEIDRAAIYFLPQNRRPQLQEFRVLSPGFGVIPATEPPASPIVSIGQLTPGQSREEEKRRGGFMTSQVIPQPGAQVVWWTVADPDGDNLVSTFSIRREDEAEWTDLAVDTRDTHAQFDTSSLRDGIYLTRLVVREAAPRPEGERLAHTFETDDLVIDHTPPELGETLATRLKDTIRVTVTGRDGLSLLEGAEFVFNNGARELIEQPADGIRDGRSETFVAELPLARAAGATSVQVTIYDAAGNSASRRLAW